MKARSLAIGLFVVAAQSAFSAAPADEAKYGAVEVAQFIDAVCQEKKGGGAGMSVAEHKQCEFVRASLEQKCFERGTCAPYSAWLKQRHDAGAE